MKKRILIVNNHLRTGGAENSLISLLNQMDYSKYEVDLYIYQNTGSYIERLPNEVNLIDGKVDKEYFLPFTEAIVRLALKGNFKSLIYKLYSNFQTKILKNNFDQVNSKIMLKLQKHNFKKKYDVCIAYKHIFSNIIVQKVNADKKIAYVHSDYISMNLNPKYDSPFINEIDTIATVSEGCLNTLIKVFPELESKTVLAPNIISPSLIRKMSMEPIETYNNYEGLKLLTVARLDVIKGIDLAIKASLKLKENNISFKWFIIGGGPQEKFKAMVDSHGLSKVFIFLGEKKNPYPYIKNADIYIQPSRTEGKSIAIEEAKVLNKPIVVTDYPTVNDQINAGFNGVVVPIDSNGIYNGILRLIEDPVFRKKLSSNLFTEELGNEKDINIFYNII
ncbi:glycosyltransferase [Rossellomorea marisflavi]|uniref:glycosyltransferase n=1 Tax=Rossellomorea marisflavi TaxID=189381 RepID=UPI00279E85A3|nr:glycosyltransferase [Rossellomorea marisflavi]UTE73410.1 glycosyltransferase [Rossellomorea marisflavi]